MTYAFIAIRIWNFLRDFTYGFCEKNENRRKKVITEQLKSSVMNFFYVLCEEFEVNFKNLQNLEKSQNRVTFSS